MSCKPIVILVSLLNATLMGLLANVNSKGLASYANSFRCNTYKNPGGRVAASRPLPHRIHLRGAADSALDQEHKPMGGRKKGH